MALLNKFFYYHHVKSQRLVRWLFGLLWATLLVMNQVKELFNTWAGTERGERMAQGHDVLVKHILEMWQGGEMQHLLDVGCGNGRALKMALEYGVQKVAGADLSDGMITEAKKNIPNGDFQNTPMQDLSYWEDDTFTHIISIEALYYLKEPLEGLKELRRVLQHNGKIAVAIDYYKESKGTHSWPDALGFELTLLSSDEWVQLFHEAGFEGVKASRIVRASYTKAEDFIPSPYAPSYELYMDYIRSGALLLAN